LGNPGNETTIQFLTKKPGNLKLNLCDATGRILKTLTEEDIEAGLKTFTVNAEIYSEGIYWVQAIFEGKVFAKKWLKVE